MAKRKHKSLHKVAEECDLQPSKMIYLDITSQKTPSCGSSNNWILIQDLCTKENSVFTELKEYLTEKVTPILK